MLYIHTAGIIHRDLKLENILVSTDLETNQVKYIKVIDFGFALFINNNNKIKKSNEDEEK